jgi:hypothetical protein
MFFLYPEMNAKERETVLSNQCAKKEMRNYSRSLTDSEVDNEKSRYINDAVEKANLEEALANLVKDYKKKIAGVEERMKERLGRIQSRKQPISGYLYGIANQQQGRMMFYDRFGELVDSRELLPDEKQGQLFLQSTNEALADLPLETAQVVMEITKEQTGNEAVEGAQVIGESDNHASNEELPQSPGNVFPLNLDDIKPEPQAEGKNQPWAPTDQTTLNNFTHDEDGWEKMTDAQLLAKYGTVDISAIRTMVNVKGKWQQPKGEAKGVVDRLKGKNKDESEQQN